MVLAYNVLVSPMWNIDYLFLDIRCWVRDLSASINNPVKYLCPRGRSVLCSPLPCRSWGITGLGDFCAMVLGGGTRSVLGVLCLSLFSFIDLQAAIQNNLQEALATLWGVHRRMCLGLDILVISYPVSLVFTSRTGAFPGLLQSWQPEAHCSLLSSTCVFLSLISDLFTIHFSPALPPEVSMSLLQLGSRTYGCSGAKGALWGELAKAKLHQDLWQAWPQHLNNGWASTWEPLVCRLSMGTDISMETVLRMLLSQGNSSHHGLWLPQSISAWEVTAYPKPSPTTSAALPQA